MVSAPLSLQDQHITKMRSTPIAQLVT